MLARITALVNEALAVEHPEVGVGGVGGWTQVVHTCGISKGTGRVLLQPQHAWTWCCMLKLLLSSPADCQPSGTVSLLQAAPLTPAEVADLIDSGNSAGGGSGRHWVLDPIDGTRGFVGMRQYAVCLGMLEQGEVRALGGWSGAVCLTFPTGLQAVRAAPCGMPSRAAELQQLLIPVLQQQASLITRFSMRRRWCWACWAAPTCRGTPSARPTATRARRGAPSLMRQWAPCLRPAKTR